MNLCQHRSACGPFAHDEEEPVEARCDGSGIGGVEGQGAFRRARGLRVARARQEPRKAHSSLRSLTDGLEEAPSRRPRGGRQSPDTRSWRAGAPDESTWSSEIATRASVSSHSLWRTVVIPCRLSSPTSLVSAELRRSRSTSVTWRPARASASASCKVVALLPSPARALVIMIVRAPAALLASSRLTRSVWTASASGPMAAA